MEYLEKAKYELIIGLQNKEESKIIDVLQQYYNDVNNIISKNNSLLEKKSHKFMVICTEKNKITSENIDNHSFIINNIKIYFFSDDYKMNLFMETYKEKYNFFYNFIKHIDPIDDKNPLIL